MSLGGQLFLWPLFLFLHICCNLHCVNLHCSNKVGREIMIYFYEDKVLGISLHWIYISLHKDIG